MMRLPPGQISPSTAFRRTVYTTIKLFPLLQEDGAESRLAQNSTTQTTPEKLLTNSVYLFVSLRQDRIWEFGAEEKVFDIRRVIVEWFKVDQQPMDLDCESEIMKSDEEITRGDKPSGTSGSNHNHYTSMQHASSEEDYSVAVGSSKDDDFIPEKF
ncbi:hypothetical protein QE152_g30162 [Popillia japonica]|uniref:Uncharacterized protein n=1 Tax=Popillia japonica TaxID=7064 RepID=A0AAW1JGE9_POPJA